MDAILLILMFLSPLFAIMLFQYLVKRSTGYDPRSELARPLFRRDEIDFLKLPEFDEQAQPQRKRKETPHYDALVDTEWAQLRQSRLEEPLAENETDAVPSLSDLLTAEKPNKTESTEP